MTTHNTPFPDNPLQFEDVALAMSLRWCVGEKQALKYARTFQTPHDALTELQANLIFPPDNFWRSL